MPTSSFATSFPKNAKHACQNDNTLATLQNGYQFTVHLKPNLPIPPLAIKSALNGLLVLSLMPVAEAVLLRLLNSDALACSGEELTPTYAELGSLVGW